MHRKVSIRQYFDQFSGKTISFTPNPGNAGDCIIASAAYGLMEESGVNYEIGSKHKPDHFAAVVYGGGGNLTTLYDNARRFLIANHEKATRLILLPHTITGNEDLLAKLRSNATIFCRELDSYNHVIQHAKNCEVLLADDLAFSLNLDSIRNFANRRNPTFKDALGIPRLVYRDSRLVAQRKKQPGDTLRAFRVDKESIFPTTPKTNIDLSECLKWITYRQYTCDWISNSFLQFIDKFDDVITDRLHIGIVAGLLQKRVTLIPGNYFKIRAVYDFSIKARWTHVRLESAVGAEEPFVH